MGTEIREQRIPYLKDLDALEQKQIYEPARLTSGRLKPLAEFVLTA